MMYEISQRFYFEASHTLDRDIDAASSKRIHGHTYHAEVTVRGPRDSTTGMVIDLALLRRAIERVREILDHALLDEVPGLCAPTLENLCAFISRHFRNFDPPVAVVSVWREASGDSCRLLIEPQ